MPIAVHESEGEGPSALLVHGNSISSRVFRHQLDGPLGAEFRLIALDLPGHGESPPPADPDRTYSVPGFASIVTGVAHALGVEDQAFIGWSFGGHVVLEAAPALPAARGFCICGTPPLRFPPNMGDAFLPHPVMRLFFQEQLTTEEEREWVRSMLASGAAFPDELLLDLRRSDRRLRPALLASIGVAGFADEVATVSGLRQPLAILHGTDDAVVDTSYLRSLAIPSLWCGDLQVIAGAGHVPQWDTPHRFDELLRSFLQSLR